MPYKLHPIIKHYYKILSFSYNYLFFYRCECPSGFDGPDCQQTKRHFNKGYAFFDTLQQCLETHTSIEFITSVSDGMYGKGADLFV